VPTKHGKGSGIRGRAASWNEEDIPNVAAVYALRHHPAVKYRPMLELVPDIKQAALTHYHTPKTGFVIMPPIASYEDIELKLQRCPEHLRDRISDDKWQELLVTWIATREKAKRGISIDKPMKVRFNWLSVEKDGVIIDCLPEIVDDTVKDDQHVLLYDSESGHDEIAIICDGVDFRMPMFSLLGFPIKV
jgi:hypothetical protein